MKHLFSLIAGLSMLCSCVQKPLFFDKDIESKVEKTLSGMTLEEKIGQMTQLTLDAIVSYDEQNGYYVDEAKLDTAVRHYKVGSFLNAPGLLPPGTIAQTPEKFNEIIRIINDASIETMGIPTLYGLDQVHGCTYVLGSTLGPQNVNVGATFNTEVARSLAEVSAYESRAASVPLSFSPCLDLTRNSCWPRNWENYGEDPYLTTMMGHAYLEGLQGDDPNHIDVYHVGSSTKHYMGYGAPVSGKDRTPAIISDADLLEKFFPPFESAARQGALCIMANSSSINGVPVHSSRELICGWLKDGLNWDGMLLTDWADINNLYLREKVASDKKDAIRIAINAGIDMAMEPYKCDYCDLLKELVEEGSVKMSRIDDAVRRILRMKYRLGLFDTPNTSFADYPDFGSEMFQSRARDAAAESMVLLKNDGVLPISREKRVFVAGPNANSIRSLNGGWTYTWQGTVADSYGSSYNTITEALSDKYEKLSFSAGVSYEPEGEYYEEHADGLAQAVTAARNSDVIIVCVGENSYCETPGNLDDLSLSANQRNLVKALSELGKPVVLVLNEGRARVISDIVDCADAIVDIMLPGNYGGDALAELICGERNFSGRLPFTYPNAVNSILTYDHKPSVQSETMVGAYNYSADASVQWPFGFGLSYTSFEYSNLTIDKEDFYADDMLTISVDVKNTGDFAGMESVLLFSSDLVASLNPDVRRLRAFQKISLEPGQSETVTFTFPARELAFAVSGREWTLEKGDFVFSAGNLSIRAKCLETEFFEKNIFLK